MSKIVGAFLLISSLFAASVPAMAEEVGGQGAASLDIKIGQTVPYSGPAAYGGTIGRVQQAFFEQLNASGGINGRKITLLSLDDAYNPTKTVEATRRLVEGEEVLAMFYSMGSGTQAAVQKYLNAKKVPQLMVGSGASRWNDPKHFPWSTSALGLYTTEASLFAKWLLRNKPNAKVAILYQNDDLGRDYVKGLKAGLGETATKMIVAEATYDTFDPTIDSQIVSLAKSGADVFYNVSIGKFASQSIRKTAELGWKPFHYIIGASAIAVVINAAGSDNAKGIHSLIYTKQPDAQEWAGDPDVQAYQSFRAKFVPNVDPGDSLGLFAYSGARVLTELIRRCGDDLSRENLLKQATNLEHFGAAHLLPGITYNIAPNDYEPIRSLFLSEYDGKQFRRLEKLDEQ